MAQAIAEAGFAVDAAGDGEVGLWYAQSGNHDAIVLGRVLPKVDGLSILKRLRRSGNRTPLLLLTAKDTVANSWPASRWVSLRYCSRRAPRFMR